MTKRTSTPADAVLVAIDMSKHRQEVLIRSRPLRLTLGRAVLANHPAGTTLGHAEHRTRIGNASTASRGA